MMANDAGIENGMFLGETRPKLMFCLATFIRGVSPKIQARPSSKKWCGLIPEPTHIPFANG